MRRLLAFSQPLVALLCASMLFGCTPPSPWLVRDRHYAPKETVFVPYGWRQRLEAAGAKDGPFAFEGLEYPLCRGMTIGEATRTEIRFVRDYGVLYLQGILWGILGGGTAAIIMGLSEGDTTTIAAGVGVLGGTALIVWLFFLLDGIDPTMEPESRVVPDDEAPINRWSPDDPYACGKGQPITRENALSIASGHKTKVMWLKSQLVDGLATVSEADMAGLRYWAYECRRPLQVKATLQHDAPTEAAFWPEGAGEPPVFTQNTLKELSALYKKKRQSLGKQDRLAAKKGLASLRKFAKMLSKLAPNEVSDRLWLEQAVRDITLRLRLLLGPSESEARSAAPHKPVEELRWPASAAKFYLSPQPAPAPADGPFLALANACISRSFDQCVEGDIVACDQALRHTTDPKKTRKYQALRHTLRVGQCEGNMVVEVPGDPQICLALAKDTDEPADAGRFLALAVKARNDQKGLDRKRAREQADQDDRREHRQEMRKNLEGIKQQKEEIKQERRRIEQSRARQREREQESSGGGLGQAFALVAGAGLAAAADISVAQKAEFMAGYTADVMSGGPATNTMEMMNEDARSRTPSGSVGTTGETPSPSRPIQPPPPSKAPPVCIPDIDPSLCNETHRPEYDACQQIEHRMVKNAQGEVVRAKFSDFSGCMKDWEKRLAACQRDQWKAWGLAHPECQKSSGRRPASTVEQ